MNREQLTVKECDAEIASVVKTQGTASHAILALPYSEDRSSNTPTHVAYTFFFLGYDMMMKIVVFFFIFFSSFSSSSSSSAGVRCTPCFPI